MAKHRKPISKPSPGPTGALEIARRKLAVGRPKEAEGLMTRFLKRDAAQPEALTLLGAALLQQGRAQEAHDRFLAAIQAKPDYVPAYRALGELLEMAGQRLDAVAAYESGLRQDDSDAECWFCLGRALKASGRFEEAVEAYEKALTLQPGLLPAQVNLGNLAQGLGDFERAAACYRAALVLDPAIAPAQSGLCLVLRQLGKPDEALAAGEAAVALDPKLAAAQGNLGIVLKDFGRFEEAITCFEAARTLEPGEPNHSYNLADACHSLSRYSEAVGAYNHTLELAPDHLPARNNFAVVMEEQGRYDRARELLEAGLARHPDDLGLTTALARVALIQADYGTAWDLAEAGFAAGLRLPDRRFAIPRWLGEPLNGRRLLVWREQGIGDEIRFAGCYADLVASGAAPVIEAEARLVGLFQRAFPTAEVRPEDSSRDAERDDVELQSPAGSLLRHFRRRAEDFPKTPYLIADPARAATWRQRLADDCLGFKIGICWRSGLASRERNRHYAGLADWAGLLRVPGVNFIVLQYGEAEAEIAAAETELGVKLHRWPDLDLKQDLEGVFALTAGLDLVITAPTAVADIAGSLGVELWCLGAGACATDQQSPHPWYQGQLFTRHWETPRPAFFNALGKQLAARIGVAGELEGSA